MIRALLLDIPLALHYNNDEGQTTHAVAPQAYSILVILSDHENSRHLAEWRLLFFARTQ